MFRTARAIVLLSMLGVISVGGLVAWATGLFARVNDTAQADYHRMIDYIDHIDLSMILTGLGALVIPVLILLIILDR